MSANAVKIIAEAGVNHNGDIRLAKRLVDAAHEAGANFIKFQTFRADSHIAPDALCAGYQTRNMGKTQSMIDMVRRLELPLEAFRKIRDHADKRGIVFISTAYEPESIDFLNSLSVPFFKIPSGELTNAPLLLHFARQNRPIAMSTGMADLEEIDRALAVLAYGFTEPPCEVPSRAAFARAAKDPIAWSKVQNWVTLLHCVTEYPAPENQLNLRAIASLQQVFGLPVGYSDHSLGTTAPIAAVALGAVMIEKHLTLDCGLEGPDHRASLEPDAFALMVEGIRATEAAMGTGVKVPGAAEAENIPIVRRSLYAAQLIRRGESFTAENLTAKRPGTGRSPYDYWDLLGSPAGRDYRADEMIDNGSEES
jgi:N-acetylneuraminate synthase